MDYTEERIARLKSLKRSKLLVAAICMAAGLILLIWPKVTMQLVCQIIGISLLADGIATAVIALVKKEGYTKPFLVAGAIIALVGAWIFLRPDALIELLPKLVGLVVLLDGVANLYECVTAIRQKTGKMLVPILMAVLTIGLGCFLIFQAMGVAKTVIRLIGFIILYNGVSDLYIASRIRTKDPDQAA
ncbi:HdeD family acid-resistance protein [Eubacterium pyruvativorans]|uniref:HdeD family acid-resistance protein n=1 Tax=Eubacterium pyruvativorans TaxID=155865 RepID=UPI00088A54C0|nr:DUF308 domain-containing protein [Eubacterium pyruvativorans]SDE54184.1 Uncharacterized membrane protein HdeD, DUF308 family [Eubacterium pyruvativorans]